MKSPRALLILSSFILAAGTSLHGSTSDEGTPKIPGKTFHIQAVDSLITSQPQNQAAPVGTNSVTFSVGVTSNAPVQFQWQFNGLSLPRATNATLVIKPVTKLKAGVYRVVVTGPDSAEISHDAVLDVYAKQTARQSMSLSLQHLRREMDLYHNRFPVYDDLGSGGNHFFAAAEISQGATVTMDNSWAQSPHSGATSIRCVLSTNGGGWGGFYLLNGILVSNAPVIYFGEDTVPGTGIPVTSATGFNLAGATSLSFWARGENGGEKIEFFMGGVGRNAVSGAATEPFADSTARIPKQGTVFTLSRSWKRFSISLAGRNLTNIMGGFAWVANKSHNPNGAVFYIDDIQYNLGAAALKRRLNQPRFIRSYSTLPLQPGVPESDANGNFDYVLRNTAYSYDNALGLLAFLADGSTDSIRRARLIGDAFVYASKKDRTYTDGRIRTAYTSGDIALPAGWSVNGQAGTIAVPGFYDVQSQTFNEVENIDIDTGNNAWAMIALLALYEKTHDTNYLATAEGIAAFIQTMRADTGIYPGFRGGISNAESSNPENRTYASTEHNLDAYAAFSTLYRLTTNATWNTAAEHARGFVEGMWDETNQCYLAGTKAGAPDERNDTASQIPLDTQSWSVLALTNALTLHSNLLAHTETSHHCTSDGFNGYDFNDDLDGVWFEGTAQMSVAYAMSGNSTNAAAIAETLRRAQQMPRPIGNGMGTVAASHDGVTSGFGFSYYRRMHLGATAWSIFAQRAFNPYYQTTANQK